MTSRLRVVEFAHGVAGAACGRLFAGLGHEVVRVERPGDDALRALPPFGASGASLVYNALNADKVAVSVDGTEAGGAAIGAADLAPLVDGADVLLIDLLPSEAERAGLGPEALAERWPELVVVWITAFARDSEFADVEGDSLLAEAHGGLATMIGDPDRRPLSLGGEQLAHASAVTGFFGATIALIRRDQGHGGDVVDVVMSDVAAYSDWKSDVVHATTGSPPRRRGTTAGGWKMLRAVDGWVGAIFQQQHWAAMVELIDDPLLRDRELADEATRLSRANEWWPAVDRWADGQTAEGIYERAQRLGLPFGWVLKASDLARSDQLRERGFILPVEADELERRPAVGAPAFSAQLEWRSGAAPAATVRATDFSWGARSRASRPPRDPDGQPLAGMLVLDFGAITAGAAVTRLLADYGATVVKVESADRPDTFRMWKVPRRADVDPRLAPDSPYFPSNNVGKRAIAIDLKTGEGRRIVHRIAEHADVVVENFRVGVTERLGIDEPTLRAINPRLNYLSLSSQGQHGPEARNRSFGSTLDLLSGLASFTGYEEDGPMWSSSDVNYPDQLVSLIGAAMVAYCHAMGLTGVTLDVSQREAVSWTLASQIADYRVNGRDSVIDGNRRRGRSPHDVYAALGEDRWVAVSCSRDEQRNALATCIGAEDLLGRDAEWWERHQDDVDRLLGVWVGARTREEAVTTLLAAGVPAVPVLDAADRAREDGLGQRFVRLPGERKPVKGFPVRFIGSGYTPPRPRRAPRLGADTAAVLTELLGVSEGDLARLVRDDTVFVPGDPASGIDEATE